MTSGQRLERDLPRILDELAVSPYPDYIDGVLAVAAHRRQRPPWTFPERWLPMTTFTARTATVPRTPLRIAVVVVLLVGALAVGAALLIGSRRPLPPPFGRAANGLVAYAAAGDIYTVDPVTGASRAIVTGPETDINPRWSRDGTLLAFERTVQGNSGPGLLYVARADGSHMVQLETAASITQINNYEFSPDGKEVLISADAGATQGLFIAEADGSGIRHLSLPGPATDAAWRPPDGSEILFMDDSANATDSTIYAINVATGKVRTILKGADAAGRYRGHASWSPDGSMISYGEWQGLNGLDVQTHVMKADGSGGVTLPSPPGTMWQGTESWSNDSTRLLVIRGYAPDTTGARPAAVPVHGVGTGIEINLPGDVNPTIPLAWEWAPDDSLILGTPTDGSGASLKQVMLDPVAGTSRTLPWTSVSLPSWQRDAP
jgi:hypothetical protein